MKLTTDINGMSLSAAGTLLNLSEHLYNLWEMWLALSSSDRNLPNSFFSILLLSMPTTPECPVVHVRRFVVDLLDRGESQLLTDLDGDNGMFVKMIKYAKQLGMQDSHPSGNRLRDGQPALNYANTDTNADTNAGGAPAGGVRLLTRRTTAAGLMRARQQRAATTGASAIAHPSTIFLSSRAFRGANTPRCCACSRRRILRRVSRFPSRS